MAVTSASRSARISSSIMARVLSSGGIGGSGSLEGIGRRGRGCTGKGFLLLRHPC